jgi:hypothetical protein
MDMLKDLLALVRDLPQTALWVLVMIFAYKVCIIGSIYGVIRLAVERLHSWATTPKHSLKTVETEIRGKIDGLCITSQTEYLLAQLHRLRGKGTGIKTQYMHDVSVDWLREAIDEKEAREREAAQTKTKAAAKVQLDQAAGA